MWIVIIITIVLLILLFYLLKKKGSKWVFKYNLSNRIDDYIIQSINDGCALKSCYFGYDTNFCKYSNMFNEDWVFMKFGSNDEIFEEFTGKRILFPVVKHYSYTMEDLKKPTSKYYKNMNNYYNAVKFGANLDEYKQLLAQFIDDQNAKYLKDNENL